MRGRITRIQTYRFLRFGAGCWQVPIIEQRDERQGAVHLGQRGVERKRTRRVHLGLREVDAGEGVAPHGLMTVCVAQTGVGERIHSVLTDGALEVALRHGEARRVAFLKVVTTLAVELVGFGTLGGVLRRRCNH